MQTFHQSIIPGSQTLPSPHSWHCASYYSFIVPQRAGGWVVLSTEWVSNLPRVAYSKLDEQWPSDLSSRLINDNTSWSLVSDTMVLGNYALLTTTTALTYITVQARNINQCAVQTRSLGSRWSCHDNTWLKLHQTGVITSASALTTRLTDMPDTKVAGIT